MAKIKNMYQYDWAVARVEEILNRNVPKAVVSGTLLGKSLDLTIHQVNEIFCLTVSDGVDLVCSSNVNADHILCKMLGHFIDSFL